MSECKNDDGRPTEADVWPLNDEGLACCPNPDCRSLRGPTVHYEDYWEQYAGTCSVCGTRGAVVSTEEEDLSEEEARARARNAWNSLPRGPRAVGDGAVPDAETAALVELLSRDNEDEDGDCITLASESWGVVYAWLAKYHRGPLASRHSNG